MGPNRLVAAGLLGVLLAGGCGQGGSPDADTAGGQGLTTVAELTDGTDLTSSTSGGSAGTVAVPGSQQPAQPLAAANLPGVDVIDVATGASHSLASLIATDRPTLLWMWAPH